MELLKNIKTILILNMITLLLLLICLFTKNINEIMFGVIAGAEILSIALLYFIVFRPLSLFERIINRQMNTEIKNEKILDDISDDIVYIKSIKKLVENFSNHKNRENSARMFDKQAELAALQSQINPHFLYNTLESIRGQALMDDNRDIAKMVEALASFFRYSISRKAELVTLRDELANIRNYMMILQYRFNNRFKLEIYIDEEDEKAYDFFIPKLILQPVVENAVFHGLEDCFEGGEIGIEVIVTERSLILTISDNGKGMEYHALQALNNRIWSGNQNTDENKNAKQQRNTGIALPNIHKRIQLLFGQEYGVNVYSTINQGTDVEITIPSNYERNSNKA